MIWGDQLDVKAVTMQRYAARLVGLEIPPLCRAAHLLLHLPHLARQLARYRDGARQPQVDLQSRPTTGWRRTLASVRGKLRGRKEAELLVLGLK